ncbi:MAG TPA: Asp23/Gls24 family envelope stress response protein [Ktedonobacterales bacterium]|nr:Asp23/Gls24 family envelope stress response protein [Ktedonobacterales bacterium]
MNASANGLNGLPTMTEAARTTPSGRPATEAEAAARLGSVRIARRVLRTVVEEAALSIPGVARLASGVSQWPQLLGRPLPRHGVGLTLHGDVATVDVYVITEPGANMVQIGSAVQEAVGAAVEHILGLRVGEINVYIQDVA